MYCWGLQDQRERGCRGRKLGHLVTSKAACNQASGSFLPAASCSRYTAGCMLGGASRFLTEMLRMMKTRLFLSWLLADQKAERHVHWQQKIALFAWGYLMSLVSDKIRKMEMLFFLLGGEIILVRDQRVTVETELWRLLKKKKEKKNAVIKPNWKHR